VRWIRPSWSVVSPPPGALMIDNPRRGQCVRFCLCVKNLAQYTFQWRGDGILPTAAAVGVRNDQSGQPIFGGGGRTTRRLVGRCTRARSLRPSTLREKEYSGGKPEMGHGLVLPCSARQVTSTRRNTWLRPQRRTTVEIRPRIRRCSTTCKPRPRRGLKGCPPVGVLH
jgi:hypothetical protein